MNVLEYLNNLLLSSINIRFGKTLFNNYDADKIWFDVSESIFLNIEIKFRLGTNIFTYMTASMFFIYAIKKTISITEQYEPLKS